MKQIRLFFKAKTEAESYELPPLKPDIKGTIKTNIEPEKRTLKNLPRYANGDAKCKFQDWLMIKKPGTLKGLKNADHSWGLGCDGKYYGWSHRAVGDFGVGDVVKPGTGGYNGKTNKELKTDRQAAQQAINFAESVSFSIILNGKLFSE